MKTRRAVLGITMLSVLYVGTCASAAAVASQLAQNSIGPVGAKSSMPAAASTSSGSSTELSRQMAYAFGYDSGGNVLARQKYLSSRTAQNLVRIENVRQAIRDAWGDQPLRYTDKQRDDAKKEIDQLLIKSWTPALGSGTSANAGLAVCYSYALGVELAYSIRPMRDQLDLEQLLLGLDQGFNQVAARLDQTTRDASLSAIREELESKRIHMNAENWQKSIDFMISNGKRPGVKTLPSGLQYEVIKAGHGSYPAGPDRVTVAYAGALSDGQVFDDFHSRGNPVTFPLNSVIPGFTEGLKLMPVGARFKLFIPPELGYGDRGAGNRIGPNQALIFDVELLDVQHSQDAIDIAPYKEASARFLEIVSSAEQHNTPSEVQSTEAMKLVSVLSDRGRFLKDRTYGVQDINDLLDLCGASNKVVMKLALFNLKAHIDASTPQAEAPAKIMALMNANAQAFGGQLKYLYPFLMRCVAVEIPPIAEFAQSLPDAQFNDERRKGLEMMGKGIAELFTGVLRGIGDKNLDPEYRWALVSTLAETAPGFVSVLQLPVRQNLRNLNGIVGVTSPNNFTSFLKRIDEALGDSSCTGLCAKQNETTVVTTATRPGAIAWVKQISEKIHGNWKSPIWMPKAVECRIKVKLLPNGSVVSATIIQSCGNPVWDSSLEKAVYKSDPLPVPEDPNDFDSNLILRVSS